MFHKRLQHLIDFQRLITSRSRGRVWSLRGAAVGRKVSVGAHCRVDNPWCLTIGDRASFEDSVYLKIVNDEATLEFGAYTFVGRGCEFDVQQQIAVGDHTLIAPGCFITDHNHSISAGVRIDQQGIEAKPVIIGNDVWIGAHVAILAGVEIGDGAVVGANAVVTKDVPSMAVVAGVPARIVRYRNVEVLDQEEISLGV